MTTEHERIQQENERDYTYDDLAFFQEQANFWRDTPNGVIMSRELEKARVYLESQRKALNELDAIREYCERQEYRTGLNHQELFNNIMNRLEREKNGGVQNTTPEPNNDATSPEMSRIKESEVKK